MNVSRVPGRFTLRRLFVVTALAAIVAWLAQGQRKIAILSSEVTECGGTLVTERRLFNLRVVKADFGGSEHVAPSLVQRIASHSSLRELVFDDCDIDLTHINALRASKNICRLSLAGCEIGDDTIPLLLSLKSLRRLNLSETEITDDSIPLLGSLPNLEMLCVAASPVTIDGLAKLDSKSIQCIDGSYCDGDALDFTVQGFGKLPNLKSVVVRGSKIRAVYMDEDRELTTLRSLDVSGTSTSIIGLADVAPLMKELAIEYQGLSKDEIVELQRFGGLQKLLLQTDHRILFIDMDDTRNRRRVSVGDSSIDVTNDVADELVEMLLDLQRRKPAVLVATHGNVSGTLYERRRIYGGTGVD